MSANDYTPLPHSLCARILDVLDRIAPKGGKVWVTAKTIARELGDGVTTTMVHTNLSAPARYRRALRRTDEFNGVMWQSGKESDDMLTPKQKTIPAAEAPRPGAVGPRSVFDIAGSQAPALSPEPIAALGVEDIVKPPAACVPNLAEPAHSKPIAVLTDGEMFDAVAAHVTAHAAEPISTGDIAATLKTVCSSQEPDDFACALFSDGRLLLELGGDEFVQLSRERTQKLLSYLDRMREPEVQS